MKPYNVSKENLEAEVLKLFSQGKSRVEIGKELGLSRAAVTRYLARRKDVARQAISENKRLRDKSVELDINFTSEYLKQASVITRAMEVLEGREDYSNLAKFIREHREFLKQVHEFKEGIIGKPQQLEITIKEQCKRWLVEDED
jgi:predicted transcriptional regulator